MHRILTFMTVIVLILIAAAPASHARWNENGIAVCKAPQHQRYPKLIPDGSDGVIAAWSDERHDNRIYAQRVDPEGTIQWSESGIQVSRTISYNPFLAPDGAGGALIVWRDYKDTPGDYNDLYAQRISRHGELLWAARGVPISTAPAGPEHYRIIPDGEGGAIIAWQSLYSESFGGPYIHHIYAQRINAAGIVQWKENGILVCHSEGQKHQPDLHPDGAGGAYIVWREKRDCKELECSDIYAQRIDGNGSLLWGDNGAAVCTASERQAYTRITGDGEGGVIVSWMDDRHGWLSGIYAQRIGKDGSTLWTRDGVPVCESNDDNRRYPEIASDGAGGAIVVWEDMRGCNICTGIFAQRIDADGNPSWKEDCLPVSRPQTSANYPDIIPDSEGGAIVTWWEQDEDGQDVFAQRIDHNGNLMWGKRGISITGQPGEGYYPRITEDGSGGAYIAWHDVRGSSCDIYMTRVGPDGNPPPQIIIPDDQPISDTGVYPNPFNPSTEISYTIERPGRATVEIYDCAGRLVRRLVDSHHEAGPHRISWDGMSDGGDQAPSGVYFCRIRSTSRELTLKMTLVR